MEKKLKALCAKHGLRTVSICVWPERETPFTAYAHDNDLESCGAGDGKTVATAVEAATANLRTRQRAA